jgi:CYTH domain-containing protein
MIEIEYELTYLAKYIPKEIEGVTPKLITDYYLPEENCEHPHLRIRAKGSSFEITKKQPLDGTDSSEQSEHTIQLNKDEYEDMVNGRTRKVSKNRYSIAIDGFAADVDVFLDELEGLVLIDFEFTSKESKDAFTPPDVCLADVTQEAFIAGGLLAGKTYADIRIQLDVYGYSKI